MESEKNVIDATLLKSDKQHFILVHGVCSGAWCWYKLKSLLESEGHKVTVPDLLASGVDETKIDYVWSFSNYCEPLFKILRDKLHRKEQVILVGNGLGGISIAMASQLYPDKVKANVFLGALMPDTKNDPSFVLNELLNKAWLPEGFWKDTEYQHSPCETKKYLRVGPDFLKYSLYNLSPQADILLAGSLVRWSSFFLQDLAKDAKFTDDGYGSVDRVLIITNDGPKAITQEFNQWQLKNSGATSIETIEKADDVAMVSNPDDVLNILLKVAASYC